MDKIKRFFKAFSIMMGILLVLGLSTTGAAWIGTIYGPIWLFVSIGIISSAIGAGYYVFETNPKN